MNLTEFMSELGKKLQNKLDAENKYFEAIGYIQNHSDKAGMVGKYLYKLPLEVQLEYALAAKNLAETPVRIYNSHPEIFESEVETDD